MGADFYPRLVATITDDAISNQLVNEQAEVSLLLAAPGVIATLAFAPLVMSVFYSAAFAAAVETLRWICMGMALRVVTWPMGFIIVAKGNKRLFFLAELAWAVVSVALAWGLVARFGHFGAGVAFFGSYVFHGLMLYPIVRHLSGFRWAHAARNTVLIFLASVALVFWGAHVLPPSWAFALGIVATVSSGAYSTRALLRLVSPERVPRTLQRVLAQLRLARWSRST